MAPLMNIDGYILPSIAFNSKQFTALTWIENPSQWLADWRGPSAPISLRVLPRCTTYALHSSCRAFRKANRIMQWRSFNNLHSSTLIMTPPFSCRCFWLWRRRAKPSFSKSVVSLLFSYKTIDRREASKLPRHRRWSRFSIWHGIGCKPINTFGYL